MNHLNRLLLPTFIVALMLFACQSKIEISPGNSALDFAVPVTKELILPEAKPINWRFYPADSLPKSATFNLDIHKLPSKPFSSNSFTALKKPPTASSFDWNKLPKQTISSDSLQYEPVKYRRFALPKPLITAAAQPSITGRGTAGLTRLSSNEGLIGNKIDVITEDKEGNAWFATEKGLTRYTGTQFESYNFFGKDVVGTTEAVCDLEWDSEGRLIAFASITGIYRIDIYAGIVEHYEFSNGYGRSTIDRNGSILVPKLRSGLFRLDMENRRIAKIRFWRDGKEQKNAYGVQKDKAGNFWVGFNDHISIIDSGFTSYRRLGVPENLPINYAFDFDEDPSGNVWISSYSKGAFSVSLKEQKIRHLGLDQGFGTISALDIFIDDMDRKWFATDDTIIIYDEKKATYKKVLSGVRISYLTYPSSGIKGSNGMIWLGTSIEGVYLVDPKGLLTDHFDSKDGLADNEIWGIEEDSKGRIWLSSYDGINIYDPEKELVYLYKFPSKKFPDNHRGIKKIGPDLFLLASEGGIIIIDIKANSLTRFYPELKGNVTTYFSGFIDNDGAFWFAGGDGLLFYDHKKKIFKEFTQKEGLSANMVFAALRDQKNRVWLCTQNNITLIDPVANTFRTLTVADGLMSKKSSMILEAQNGDIYLGNDAGISLLDSELKTITNIGPENGFLPNVHYDMVESNGRIHIGTENGITILHRPADPQKSWQFFNYSKSAGIPYNDYNQNTAYVAANGDVWWSAAPITTVVHQDLILDSTLPRVNITALNIMDEQGEFLNRAALRSRLNDNDSIWFGDKLYTGGNLPEDSGYMKKNNIRWDSLQNGFRIPAGLELPFNQNSLHFRFSNPSPIARDKIKYRFILEGYDDAWSDITDKTISRIYYNLNPGNYTFKVITRGLNGRWSEPAAFSFTIRPPWWQTWWAFLLYALAAITIIYFTVRIRSNMLQKENRILEKKVQLRTQALNHKMDELKAAQNQLVQSEKMASLGELTAGIAHEIQNPLNFINNFAEVNQELLDEIYQEIENNDLNAIKDLAADIKSNEEKIFHHGKRADAIVKSMLQHSRGNNNLTKEPTDINKLADEYLRLAYHGLRAKDKSFNSGMKTNLDENLPLVNIVPQDIGRVVLNLLTNAFYAVSEKKKQNPENYQPMVTVGTQKRDDYVEITVTDNGDGIPEKVKEKIYQPFFTTKPTGQGTGLGLSMSYDIVTKSHEGQLIVESREGEGSTFTILLPIKSN